MATGGAPATHELLTGSDRVSVRLLTYVSLHVDPKMRTHFALSELGFNDVQVANIEEDKKGSSVLISLQILIDWLKKTSPMNVGHFMKELVSWERDGYLGNSVWLGLGSLVEPELLVQQLPAPGTTTGRKKPPEKKRIEYIQNRLKSSLRRRCRLKLSTDWLPSDKAKFYRLRDHFVELKQRKKVERALRDTAEDINTIHDILKITVAEGGVNIALRGEAGIGKSSSMAMLASDWAEGEEVLTKTKTGGKSKLVQFSWAFLTSLGNVKDNASLDEIITKQHGLTDVPESQIRSILEGEHGKVLLLLDGYDEYEKGTNSDIDRAIEDTVGECFLIVTSREGDYMSKETLLKIDGEIEITGFSEDSIEICAGKFLGSDNSAEDFISKSKAAGIYELLRVPIILLMTVVLYHESSEKLPKSLTQIVQRTVFLMIDRCTLKLFGGRKWDEIVGLEKMLKEMGRLCLEALKKGKSRISKEDVFAISPALLKLGLLHGDFLDEMSSRGKDVMMSYPHKLFLEFFAAFYAVDFVQGDIEMFERFPAVMTDRIIQMMATFMFGLAEDKHNVLAIVCKELKKENKSLARHYHLLHSFSKEPSPGINPLYNKWICSMNDYLPRPDVHSVTFMFDESLAVKWKGHPGVTSTLPTVRHMQCDVYIYYKTELYLHRLLQTFPEADRTIFSLHLQQIEPSVSHVDQVQTFSPLKLKINDALGTDQSDVTFYKCDMRFPVLQDIFQHLSLINKLVLDYIRNFPESVFSHIDQLQRLKSIDIFGGHFSFNVSHAFQTLLPRLPNLENFALFTEPTQRDNQPLEFGDRVSLIHTLFSLCNHKRLLLRSIMLSDVIAEACKDSRSSLPNLNLLILNNVQLTQHDILALEKLVSENQIPALNELYLQRNNFTNCRASLEKLLRTVDNKLPDCQVFVSPEKLPVNLNTNYRCLRIQSGPERYMLPNDYSWHINPPGR